MVKQLQRWKTEWNANDDSNGGAMAVAIEKCAHGEVVIMSQFKKLPRLYASVSPRDLIKLLDTNKGIYECLSHYPRKVYFDIDCKKKDIGDEKFAKYFEHHKEYLEDCCDIIGDAFAGADLAVSGSITDYAISYHITLTNYCIHNKEQLDMMKHIVREMCSLEPTFDVKVYTRNRFMKSIGQTKPDDERVQNILSNNNIKDHLITCFLPETPLPFPEPKGAVAEAVRVEQSKKPINLLADLPALVKVATTEAQRDILENCELEDLTPSQMLTLMPCDKSFPHSHTWRMCRFAFYNCIPVEEFITWYRQKHNDAESLAKYRDIHYPNAHKYATTPTAQIHKLLIHFYPQLAKDVHYRRFHASFELPAEKIQKVATLTQSVFSKGRVDILNTGMGSGKTHQTIEYLQKNNPSFIWVCPNRALAQNTLTRLQQSFTADDGKERVLNVTHYGGFTKKEKADGIFDTINRLIIVANSLHYIKQKTYDCVVIDEIETMIDKWEGSFINSFSHKLASWNSWLNIFKNAKKIILLDAFITTKTLHFIESVGIANYTVFERAVEPTTRHIQYHSDLATTLKLILDDVRAKKKVFIFYPYKDGKATHPSMMTLANIIEKECDLPANRVKFYNADIDDKAKDDIKDVTVSWCDIDVVITNNIITCGVNFDTDIVAEQFDKKYLFIAAHNSPRDIIQVSYRARALKDNIIHVCFLGRMVQNAVWEDDTETVMKGCPVYKQLYRDILIEKKSPIRKTFSLLCNKAHYRQHPEKKNQIRDELTQTVESLQRKHNIDIDFTRIDNITDDYAEHIRQRIIMNDATTLEKMRLKKYQFLQNFTEESLDLLYTDEDHGVVSFVEYMWKNNLITFVDKVYEESNRPDNVFKTVQKAFKWPTIIPVSKADTKLLDKKLKLSDTIKSQFFKEFNYKFCNMASYTLHLLSITYNAYFGCDIIKTNYCASSKITSYSVFDVWSRMYTFCIANRRKYVSDVPTGTLDEVESIEICDAEPIDTAPIPICRITVQSDTDSVGDYCLKCNKWRSGITYVCVCAEPEFKTTATQSGLVGVQNIVMATAVNWPDIAPATKQQKEREERQAAAAEAKRIKAMREFQAWKARQATTGTKY